MKEIPTAITKKAIQESLQKDSNKDQAETAFDEIYLNRPGRHKIYLSRVKK